ncbi:MAG: galactose mutarotase [Acutalibacter sp.]|jgi:aldose 1-epimerase|nr:galactose mutarotase [Acutalibacter sp.]
MAADIKPFGTLPDGREVQAITLEKGGISLTVTNYGCRVLRLMAPDRDGNPGDVVLGHRTLEEYFGKNFQGAAIGRFGNRIGGAAFTVDGQEYTLAKNDGENSLHGGPGGFHQALWAVEVPEGEDTVIFTLESPDGEEGFPGTVKASITYTLGDQDTLRIIYRAVSDKKTPFNPTNHSFFNLSGDPAKDVLGTELTINAQRITAVRDDLIPTGELIHVADGPLDFRGPKALGKDMFAQDHLIQLCKGFDHNFCTDGSGYRKIAEAYEPDSGRVMEVFTDMPGVQLYTFNIPDEGLVGKDGQPMRPHTAFCLETQFYPDTVHHENFPGGWLEKGQEFVSKTTYKFSVR